MPVLSGFRKFALRGNLVDMATGITVGAAFGALAKSLVDDIIMPPIGLLLAGIDFSALKLILREAAPAVGAEGAPGFIAATPEVAINYGKFINAAIKFVIVAWVLFMVIKGMNTLKRKEEAKPAPVAETPADIKLLTEIRDALKARP